MNYTTSRLTCVLLFLLFHFSYHKKEKDDPFLLILDLRSEIYDFWMYRLSKKYSVQGATF